jgi:hypothetical protein
LLRAVGLEEYSVVRFPTPYRLIITQTVTSSQPRNVGGRDPAEGTGGGEQDDTAQVAPNAALGGSATEQRLADVSGGDDSGEALDLNNLSHKRPRTA